MPNWCNNHIVIEGPTDKVEAIWSKASDESEEGLLGALHPIGEWDYHKAVDEWGTKWDVSLSDSNLELEMINESTSAIVGYFESAWSPPLNAIMHYEEANPDVDIHCMYYEPANDFVGSNHYGDFSITDQPRSFWETDPAGQDLDGTFYVTEMLDEYQDELEDQHLDDDTLVDPEKLPE
jgi:hypothetical protein